MHLSDSISYRFKVAFGIPRGSQGVELRYPGGFGVYGNGFIEFDAEHLHLLGVVKNMSGYWTLVLCYIALWLLLYFVFHYQQPILLFLVLLAGPLFRKRVIVVIPRNSVSKVMSIGSCVQFEATSTEGTSDRVFLKPVNMPEAESIRRLLAEEALDRDDIPDTPGLEWG